MIVKARRQMSIAKGLTGKTEVFLVHEDTARTTELVEVVPDTSKSVSVLGQRFTIPDNLTEVSQDIGQIH